MPKVSVIVPTCNRAALIGSAIGSVLEQTYQNFEIVVVDDASTDNTRDTIASFEDPRLKYIRHVINKGDAASRNTGISYSDGDYVAFLDDDDEWLPDKLQMQIDVLSNCSPRVGMVYTGFVKRDKRNGKIVAVKTTGKRGDLLQEILCSNFIATPCILLRRECFQRVGMFDERMPCNSDYDMWIRLAEHFHFECIDEPLVVVNHSHGPKLSMNLPLVIQGWEILFQKYRRAFMSNKPRISRVYYDLGILYFLNGDVYKSRRALFNAIEFYPLGIKSYLALFISLLGSGALRLAIETNEKITAPLRRIKATQELQRLAANSVIPTVRLLCRSSIT
jgi:glycosyltransferase involved in cell wall biosynthesis